MLMIRVGREVGSRRGRSSARPAPRASGVSPVGSERLEEGYELVLLRRRESAIVVNDERRLARVAQYRVVAVCGLAIVHQATARAHAPERRGAHEGGRRLTGVLNNAIARADVVHQEVAEGVYVLVAESGGDCERSAVNQSARRGGRDGADVADIPAHLIEEVRACDGVRGVGDSRVARRRFGRAHEGGEGVDVLVAVLAAVDARVADAGL